MRLNPKTLLQLSAMALVCATSAAFINPAFTPVDLVKQSDIVVSLDFKNIDDKGVATATVTKVLKGKLDQKELKIDLMAALTESEGKAVIQRIKAGSKDAMMFIGIFNTGDEDGGKPEREARGFLHLNGPGGDWQWITTLRAPEGAWEMDKIDDKMSGTWSGGTDMLLRAINYVLHDPDANLPVKESIDWGKEISLGKIDGKVFAAAPVDVDANGKTALFLAAEKGDRLFRWDGKAFTPTQLKSSSHAFAWADFNADGKIDLASWDGKELSIFSQQNGGAFSQKLVNAPLKDGCIALTTIDAGTKTPALLVSTKTGPLILTIQPDGTASPHPLATSAPANAGEPAESLAADFDNDGLTDIIQLFSDGAMFYKGTKPGEFAAPAKAHLAAGKGAHGSCIGDWDADGLLDIFTTAEDRNHLWQNLGHGNFADTIHYSGSVAYISKAGGTFAQTSDFNNQGRQGIFMLYGASYMPQLFFNRGFRSFGLSRKLEGEIEKTPDISKGQQAGCLGDFTGIGAPSMAVVLMNGDAWVFPRKSDDKPLGVKLALSLESPTPGPVTVWANNDKRPFGATVVRAGEPGFFYGVEEAGPITVKWRFPGGQIQQKEVIIEDGTKTFALDKAAK